ncbi:hypothetical protein HDE_09847 [Halotydeus destructor]|nr:hypothetical protein HDE_09847 [Halotydeus destructor]
MESAQGNGNASSTKSVTLRYWFTFVIYFANLTYGLAYSLWGAVWPDLQDVLERDGDAMKYGLTVRCVGCAIGAIFCGLLPEKYSRFHMLLGSLVLTVVSLIATPLFRNYINFLFMQVLFGIAVGSFETVGMVLIIYLWSPTKYEATALQALQLVWGVGAFISPLLAEPFIASDVPVIKAGARGQSLPFANYSCSSNQIGNTVALETRTGSDEFPRVLQGDEAITGIKHQSLIWPFVITSAIASVVVTLMLLKPLKSENVDDSDNQETKKSEAALEQQSQQSRTPSSVEATEHLKDGATERIITIFLVSAVVFFAAGTENTNGSYFMVFLLSTDLHLSKSRALQINSTYNGTYALFRAIGVLLVIYVKPATIIFANIAILLVSTSIYWVYHDTWELGVWVATILMAVGFSTMYGNIVSVTSQLITVTNLVGAIITLASFSSSAIYPIIIGGEVEREPLVLILENFISIIAVLVLFCSLLIYVKLHSKPANEKSIEMTRL